jgi:hypothetical protein
MPTVQKNNAEMKDLLKSEFVSRYDPATAWGNAISMHLGLLGLRGFWGMAAIGPSGGVRDQSGMGQDLSHIDAQYTLNAVTPYADLNGTTAYLLRADEAALDIIGTESHIASAYRGLTLGGWFWFDRLGVFEGLMGKALGGNLAYAIQKLNTNVVRFFMSTNGTTTVAANHTTASVTGSWHFFVGRFTPSTEVALFYDKVKVVNTTSIPATINNSNSNFEIGRATGATQFLDGRAALCWLCSAALPDYVIISLYHHTRALFGV